MIGHKMLWDAAMKPRLDARGRIGTVPSFAARRFDPVELPFGRFCDGDGAGHSTSLPNKDTST